jgi:hypothetical protein
VDSRRTERKLENKKERAGEQSDSHSLKPTFGGRLQKGDTPSLPREAVFARMNLYPDPLHLVEASYSWDRLKAA